MNKKVAIIMFTMYMVVFGMLMYLCMSRTQYHVYTYEYIDEQELLDNEKKVEL